MAAATLPRPILVHRSASMDAMASDMVLDTLAQPIPNKHIPHCPPGSPRSNATNYYDSDEDNASASSSEANSTSTSSLSIDAMGTCSSLLYPPVGFARIRSLSLSGRVRSSLSPSMAPYEILPSHLAAAINHAATQPLPDPSLVFPWLHGMHPQNMLQLSFFTTRNRSVPKTPTCMRGLTIIKADGDLTSSRLKGAVGWAEVMQPDEARFLSVDPRSGFSVRNFHIQVAKTAVMSDIVVYGEDKATVHKLGWNAALAQHRWCMWQAEKGQVIPEYNTFVCVSPFAEFEQHHPEIVATTSLGAATGNVLDFYIQERREMYAMTEPVEISHNVWLGPTPDATTDDDEKYSILVECSDLGLLNPVALRKIAENSSHTTTINQHFVEFPASGSVQPPMPWCMADSDGILETCKWLYALSHGVHPKSPEFYGVAEDEPSPRHLPKVCARKVLIHCPDGYTETTLLAVAYHSFVTGRSIHEAWIDLHTRLRRNCFAYSADVAVLRAIEPRLLSMSPRNHNSTIGDMTALIKGTPSWWDAFDGSFPSRILGYMYLGNLKHANNPHLLKAIGIGQILSVGEMVEWSDEDAAMWGGDNVCVVQDVQDNGIDPLTNEFARCLEFIDRGRRNGTATLVHCRVGVSRSATICIAEVMRALEMSFPRAYCFVRARRLNVIIQPHLRFAYELLKWEEHLHEQKHGDGDAFKRELEWNEIARQIAHMNIPYSR